MAYKINYATGQMEWVPDTPKKTSQLTKPGQPTTLNTVLKSANLGPMYIGAEGNLAQGTAPANLPGPESSQFMLQNTRAAGIENPNDFGATRAEKSQGANVGDIRQFGSNLWRWNGVDWELKGNADVYNRQEQANAFQGTTTSFIDSLRRFLGGTAPSPAKDQPSFLTTTAMSDRERQRNDLQSLVAGFNLSQPVYKEGINNPFLSQLAARGSLIGSGIVGGLGSLLTPGTVQAADYGVTPYERHLSESLRSGVYVPAGGLPGSPKNYIDSGKAFSALEGSGSKQLVQDLQKNNPYMSFNTDVKNKLTALDQRQSELDGALQGLQGLGPEQGEQGVLIMDDLERTSSRLYQDLVDGVRSEEETVRAWEEAQREAANRAYDIIIDAKEKQIPLVSGQYDSIISSLNRFISEGAEDVEKANIDTENRANELVRQRYANQRASEEGLRNLFTGLGTAESSAFINELGKIQREGDTDVNRIETTKLDQIASNNKEYNRYKATVQDKIATTENEKNTKIQQLMADLSLTREEKAQKILEVALTAQQRVDALRSDLRDKAVEFANIEMTARYGIGSQILQNKLDLESLAQGTFAQQNPNAFLASYGLGDSQLPSNQGYYVPKNSRQQSLATQIEDWLTKGQGLNQSPVFINTLIQQNPEEAEFIRGYYMDKLRAQGTL